MSRILCLYCRYCKCVQGFSVYIAVIANVFKDSLFVLRLLQMYSRILCLYCRYCKCVQGFSVCIAVIANVFKDSLFVLRLLHMCSRILCLHCGYCKCVQGSSVCIAVIANVFKDPLLALRLLQKCSRIHCLYCGYCKCTIVLSLLQSVVKAGRCYCGPFLVTWSFIFFQFRFLHSKSFLKRLLYIKGINFSLFSEETASFQNDRKKKQQLEQSYLSCKYSNSL